MKRCLLFALWLICLVPAGSGSISAQDKEDFKLTDDEQQVLDLTNQERKKENLSALKASPLLCKVARAHSANMARQGKMEHNLDGKTPFERIKGSGYKYSLAAENIAVGNLTHADVMKAWMKSKIHRDNIMDGEFTEIGLGLVKNDKGKIYYTQVFAVPRK